MNDLLELKGEFQTAKASMAFAKPNFKNGEVLRLDHLLSLKKDLENIKKTRDDKKVIDGYLFEVQYGRIIPKSSRIQELFKKSSSEPTEDKVVGVKFNDYNGQKCHVFTYFVDKYSFEKTIKIIEDCIFFIESKGKDFITNHDIDNIYSKKERGKFCSMTSLVKALVDLKNIEEFTIGQFDFNNKGSAIVTFYKTNLSVKDILNLCNIDYSITNLDESSCSVLLDEISIRKVLDKVPELVSMGVTDITSKDFEEKFSGERYDYSLPKPTNEPTIGVFDTPFKQNDIFKDWVEVHNLLSKDIIDERDYEHGSAVSSLIVAGPMYNEDLQDDCGYFKVRHFGIAKHDKQSSFEFIKNVRQIVSTNLDIKVWNISFGSNLEVNQNFISYEGAELDKLQKEFNIIFVISGTNLKEGEKGSYFIGAPADSLNSLAVNSVNMSKEKASYSRHGPVLSFFNKPDVSYYGGDKDRMIASYDGIGINYFNGTSYAAPLISRKLGYLIYKIGLPICVAKALIIDSATTWNNIGKADSYKGFGVVPIKIEDVLNSKNDEIKFYIHGFTNTYSIYTYSLPIPQDKNEKFPFYAKATLVYSTSCTRSLGVDYTNNELDIQFGRVKEKNGETTIETIDGNYQSSEHDGYTFEEDARKIYRKRDNVKSLGEIIPSRPLPKKSYGKGMRGIKITSKNRNGKQTDNELVGTRERPSIEFGLVITLKEMFGENRYNDFINKCQFRGWIVNKINVDNINKLNNKLQEDIEFD